MVKRMVIVRVCVHSINYLAKPIYIAAFTLYVLLSGLEHVFVQLSNIYKQGIRPYPLWPYLKNSLFVTRSFSLLVEVILITHHC